MPFAGLADDNEQIRSQWLLGVFEAREKVILNELLCRDPCEHGVLENVVIVTALR